MQRSSVTFQAARRVMSQRFIVWYPDDGEAGPDDGRGFEGYSFINAAEQWADRHDDEGADEGSCWDVMVKDSFGVTMSLRVTKCIDVRYDAAEVAS